MGGPLRAVVQCEGLLGVRVVLGAFRVPPTGIEGLSGYNVMLGNRVVAEIQRISACVTFLPSLQPLNILCVIKIHVNFVSQTV